MLRSATTFRSFIYSLLLHTAALALFIVSIEFTPETLFPRASETRIVNAVTVDEKQVQAELDRLQEIEKSKARKRQELERKLAEIEKKTAAAEKQRKVEEKRLADLAKKKEQEREEREEELEQQRKLEEDRKRKVQDEMKRAADEKQRKEAEEALKQRMAEEEAEQAAQNQAIINEYARKIKSAISQEFNTTGLPPGLSCLLRIRTIPGGDVVDVRIARSSGNALFDNRAEVATKKASPLPVPDDSRVFETMREINLEFAPEN